MKKPGGRAKAKSTSKLNNNSKGKKGSKGKDGGPGGQGQWNLVPIGEDFLAEQEMESLISLEVLTDYDLVQRADGLTEIVEKGRKRKVAEVDSDSDADASGDDAEADIAETTNDSDHSSAEEEVEEKPLKKGKKAPKKDALKLKSKPEIAVKVVTGTLGVSATSQWTVVPSNASSAAAALDAAASKREKKAKDRSSGAEAEDAENGSKSTASGHQLKKSVKVLKTKQESLENEPTMEKWVKLGVRDPILQGLKDAQFTQPTAIQEATLPSALIGKKDIVGAAETGSGKTLAFAIPIIHGILQNRSERLNNPEAKVGHGLQALILTPTRELAVQIKKHFDTAARYARIKTVVIVGGLAAQKQERLLRGQPDVVIATPGRLWELTREGNPHLSTLNEIRYLTIDETDRMVEKGHFQELQGILGVINSSPQIQELRQNFVFSATLSFTHEPPQRTGKKFKKGPKKLTAKDKLKQIMELIGVRPNPKIVDITNSKGTCETLTEMQINCSLIQKDFYLYYFLMLQPGRTIVFCNSINCVRRLTNLFFLLKVGEVLPLHSEMFQKQRLKNLEKFTENDKGILIATDVAARGLDIVDVQHVIHYQVPKTAEGYIHRSGRTARAFKGGLAIVLVEPAEIQTLRNIFRSLNRDGDTMLPLFNIDHGIFKKLKARVEEAVKVEQFEHSVRKRLADMNWMDKAKKDMDLASSDESDDSENGDEASKKNLMQAKKKLESYKQSLSKLLADDTFLVKNSVKTSSK